MFEALVGILYRNKSANSILLERGGGKVTAGVKAHNPQSVRKLSKIFFHHGPKI